MIRKWKILTLAFCAGLLLLSLVVRILSMRDPISQDFPLSEVWETRLGGNIVGISIADQNLVLVRTISSLNAVDTKRGNIIWRYTLSWQAEPQPAVVKDGKVYVSDGNFLVALNQEDGSLIWQQPTSYTESWVTDVSKDIVIVNQVGVDILVFDTNTGSFLWRKPVCRGFVQAFTDNQSVYIPCYDLESVDAISGETSWKAEIGVRGNIGHSESVVYYLSGLIEAYDIQNQKNLWSTSVVNNGFESFNLVDNDLFYTDASRLCMLDTSSGHLDWCVKTPYPQSPTVINNTAYVFDGSHKVVTAIQMSDGKIIGSLNLSNFNYFIVDMQLLASTDNLLFFANGKNIYAYGN